MRKTWILIGLPLLLGGCGLPPAISVASWALDGMSYVVSGKSVTDHAISEIANQDCALFRVVQEREVCVDFETDDEGPILSASALVEPGGSGMPAPVDPALAVAGIDDFARAFGPDAEFSEPDTAASFAQAGPSHRSAVQPAGVTLVAATDAAVVKALPDLKPVAPRTRASEVELSPAVVAEIARLDARPREAGEIRMAAAPEPAAAPRPKKIRDYMSVVGSFRDADNALGLAAKLDAYGARVRTFHKDGATWHRVLTDASLETVRDAGFADAWPLRGPVVRYTQLAQAH